jgi:drug/metabolite transporter (DMT)-like permease
MTDISRKNSLPAHLAVLCANLLFGINFSMVKIISPELIAPAALNLIRVLVSVGLFWLMFLFKPSKIRIEKKDLIRFFLCALTGVTINQLLFIKGLTLSTPIHGALLILATPVFILLLSLFVGSEKFSSGKIAGLLFAIAGATVLILSKGESTIGSNMLLGDILITINGISYAVYFLLAKPLMVKYGPLTVIRWVFTFGLPMMLPFCWSDFLATDWERFNINAFGALAFVVIGATFFAYLFTSFGLHQLSPSATGAYIYVQPVFSAAVSIVFLNEEAALYKLLAAVLIFSGVFMINRKNFISKSKKGGTSLSSLR